MKQTIITLAIIGTILTIMAFSNSDNKSVGAIGDVKYSVLPPDKFKEENGNGWVLMDDRIPLQGSDLNTKHGVTSLPDARGLFIRGLNLKRNDDKADPFEKEKNHSRLMGEYQNDAIQDHRHLSPTNTPDNAGNGYFGSYHKKTNYVIYGASAGTTYPAASSSPTSIDNENEPFISSETRPKNITCYTYIKINE